MRSQSFLGVKKRGDKGGGEEGKRGKRGDGAWSGKRGEEWREKGGRKVARSAALQLPMGWGVGDELTKSWPTFEQLCVQNLALAISYCFSPTKSAYKIRLARSWPRVGQRLANFWHEHFRVEIAGVFLAVVLWQHPKLVLTAFQRCCAIFPKLNQAVPFLYFYSLHALSMQRKSSAARTLAPSTPSSRLWKSILWPVKLCQVPFSEKKAATVEVDRRPN